MARTARLSLASSALLLTVLGCAPKGDLKDLAGTWEDATDAAKVRTLTVDESEMKVESKNGSEKLTWMGVKCDRPGHCTSDHLMGKYELTKDGDTLTVVGGSFAGTYKKK